MGGWSGHPSTFITYCINFAALGSSGLIRHEGGVRAILSSGSHVGCRVPIKKNALRKGAAWGYTEAEGVKRDGPGTGLPGPLRGVGLLVLVT